MNNETICVIGCSGFVGSHVTAELLSRGYSVNGTLRDASEENTGWLKDRLGSLAADGQRLTLLSAELGDKASLRNAMRGCSGVIMCAGVERQEPATIDLMVGAADHILDAALELGIKRAVFTSSTGSTNPPEGEPELKNEVDHWSDPERQQAAGKYSPAAKTLMDKTALARMEASGGALRVCVFNPSMISGPAYQTEPVGSLKAFRAIIAQERFADRIPNGSMSMIDVRDLAKLHVNALENGNANGRYFGVKQSWHWQDILAALKRAYPAYELPEFPAGETPARATQFDLTRQSTLGCELRDLDEMVSSVVQELQRREML
ncbi:MAG: NAD-dependent epimerase/dehydratase family protein [Gammaproteobacteria bacterium]|nr:NAD-dependent epimerase/dehydratase family protein [Gammaproteobacteria bacterium]